MAKGFIIEELRVTGGTLRLRDSQTGKVVEVPLTVEGALTLPGEDGPDAASPCYVNFEGEVPWEPEHGLQLVFDATGAVCRVGPYTGHLTVSPSILAAYPGTIYG